MRCSLESKVGTYPYSILEQLAIGTVGAVDTLSRDLLGLYKYYV